MILSSFGTMNLSSEKQRRKSCFHLLLVSIFAHSRLLTAVLTCDKRKEVEKMDEGKSVQLVF